MKTVIKQPMINENKLYQERIGTKVPLIGITLFITYMPAHTVIY